MILENTFTSMEKTVDYLFPPLKIFTKLILRNKWRSEEYIQNISSPILFIKCLSLSKKSIFKFFLAGRDEIIPCFMIDELRNQAKKAQFTDLVIIFFNYLNYTICSIILKKEITILTG